MAGSEKAFFHQLFWQKFFFHKFFFFTIFFFHKFFFHKFFFPNFFFHIFSPKKNFVQKLFLEKNFKLFQKNFTFFRKTSTYFQKKKISTNINFVFYYSILLPIILRKTCIEGCSRSVSCPCASHNTSASRHTQPVTHNTFSASGAQR